MKAIVVGGGIVGLGAAWALLRQGADVTLVEQGPLPNPLASSVDQHRLIRYPYGAARGYTRMVDAAFDAWERVWADLGVRLFHETGTLLLAQPGDDWVEQSLAVMAAEGIAHRHIPLPQLADEFPYLRSDGLATAVHCQHGGLLRADAIVGSLKHWALDRGLQLRSQTQVLGVDAEAGQVQLADGSRLTADHVLVAAGPWTAQLLPDLAGIARPSRQVIVYLTPPPAYVAAWYQAPMLLDIGAASGFYAVPPRVCNDGMRLGLKVGDHRFGDTADPGTARDPTDDEIAAVLAPARQRLADGAAYGIVQAKTCFYDVAPEETFRFQRLGARALALCGTSGHGFKFGPCLGEAMAAVLLGRADEAAVRDWIAGGVQPQPPHIIPVPAAASSSSG